MASEVKYYPQSTKVISWGAMTGRIVKASATTVALGPGAYHVKDRMVNLLAQSSAVTVSGSAGWRYVLVDTDGVCAVETIPGGEITADTTKYTPNPTFSNAYGGYYSSVSTSKRIAGILYFDSSVITEIIPYGNSYQKNDNLIEVATYSSLVNDTVRFATDHTLRGTDATKSDDGTNATRVTANVPGILSMSVKAQSSGPGFIVIAKNSSTTYSVGNHLKAKGLGVSGNDGGCSADIPMSPGDYVTVQLQGSLAATANECGFVAVFKPF